jgi:hypothetical protein
LLELSQPFHSPTLGSRRSRCSFSDEIAEPLIAVTTAAMNRPRTTQLKITGMAISCALALGAQAAFFPELME